MEIPIREFLYLKDPFQKDYTVIYCAKSIKRKILKEIMGQRKTRHERQRFRNFYITFVVNNFNNYMI